MMLTMIPVFLGIVIFEISVPSTPVMGIPRGRTTSWRVLERLSAVNIALREDETYVLFTYGTGGYLDRNSLIQGFPGKVLGCLQSKRFPAYGIQVRKAIQIVEIQGAFGCSLREFGTKLLLDFNMFAQQMENAGECR